MAKLSEALKEKIEATTYKQDNSLEQQYIQRWKELNIELENETKAKSQLSDKLRKKKEELKVLKNQIAKQQNKEKRHFNIQCDMEKEEKLKFHSRPKPPVTKLMSIFDEVIHGIS